MSKAKAPLRPDYVMQFDIGTIRHLGLRMYSTLPPVMGELVANAWDADAASVKISVPTSLIDPRSEIVIEDDGSGMTDQDVRNSYLIIGRDRRRVNGDKETSGGRKVMGRKGIGKFSPFGIAAEIEVETVCNGETSRFVMNLSEFEKHAAQRELRMPALPPTGKVKKGTRVTLRSITKYHTRAIPIQPLRRGLARRFSVIGDGSGFGVEINGSPIGVDERDLQLLLERDESGKLYLWNVDEEISPDTGWRVHGWIGGLKRTDPLLDGVQRGIAIMARGKMVQEPFVFDAVPGQQFALSYLVGELHAEFVDDVEDNIATTRNSLVWDTEANIALKEWGKLTVNRIAREWAEKRQKDNAAQLAVHPLYKRFQAETKEFDDVVTKRVAEKLIREIVVRNPTADVKEQEPVIEACISLVEFDAFKDLATRLTEADVWDVPKIVQLFRDWEIIEAKEMMKVTEGRITTIEKLQKLIESNALEVPTLHNFLKEFPWVLDPRWTLIADEKHYSKLLNEKFPESSDTPEEDKRIDFLCVRESSDLIVVEIKRPKSKASKKELDQIEEYVSFMRHHTGKTTDAEFSSNEAVGYLLVGDVVNTYAVQGRIKNLAKANIFVRKYSDLLRMVERSHQEFLERYQKLRKSSSKA